MEEGGRKGRRGRAMEKRRDGRGEGGRWKRRGREVEMEEEMEGGGEKKQRKETYMYY